MKLENKKNCSILSGLFLKEISLDEQIANLGCRKNIEFNTTRLTARVFTISRMVIYSRQPEKELLSDILTLVVSGDQTTGKNQSCCSWVHPRISKIYSQVKSFYIWWPVKLFDEYHRLYSLIAKLTTTFNIHNFPSVSGSWNSFRCLWIGLKN